MAPSLYFCLSVLWLACAAHAVIPDSFDGSESLVNFGLPDWENVAEFQSASSTNINISLTLNDTTKSWTASLECQFSCDAQFDLSWHTVDGRRIDGQTHNPNEKVTTTYNKNTGIVTSFLDISNFDYDLSRDYTCLIVTPTGFENATVLALFQPELNVTNSTIQVQEGDTVSVLCSSVSGAVLEWRLPGYGGDRNVEFEVGSDPKSDSFWNMMILTAGARDTSKNYCCCVEGRDSKRQSSCTCVTVEVYAPPTVLPTIMCLAKGRCLMVCSAYGYPTIEDNDLYWTALNFDNSSLDVKLESKYNERNYFTFAKTIIDDYSLYDAYSCSANNSYGAASYNTSDLDVGTETIVPPFLASSMVKVVPASKIANFSVSYLCEFQANPVLKNIGWSKIPVYGNFTGAVLLDPSSYDIRTWNLTTRATVTQLTIHSLDNTNVASYMCFAQNDCGFLWSRSLMPNTTITDFSVAINNEFPKNGTLVEMTCSGSSFPPPEIDWKVLAEFSLDYQIEGASDSTTGFATSTVSFLADSANDHVYLECSVYSDFKITNLLVGSKTVIVNHLPEITSTNSCTPDTFSGGNQCVLSVSIQIGNNYTETTSGWLYHLESEDSVGRYTNITDDVQETQESLYRKRYTLTLTSYNGGDYVFWAVYSSGDDRVNISQSFVINPNQQVAYLGQKCDQSSQCLTLHSECQNSTCQCVAPNVVKSEDDNNATVCLPVVEPGETCQLSKQCADAAPNYFCSLDTNICTCGGVNISVDGQFHCIQAAKHDKPCDWDEECWLTDVNSWCENGMCQCYSGFNFNTNDQQCVGQGSLSGAAIAVICVFALLLTALLGALIGGCVKRRRNKQSRSGRNDSCMPSDDHDSDANIDVPYAQFTNPVEETGDSPIQIIESVENQNYSEI